MPVYNVYVSINVSKSIEAASEEAALEILEKEIEDDWAKSTLGLKSISLEEISENSVEETDDLPDT